MSTCSFHTQQASHPRDITLNMEASPQTTAIQSTSQKMAQESTNAAEAWLRTEAKIPRSNGTGLPPLRDWRHAVSWACFDAAISHACLQVHAALLKDKDWTAKEDNYPKILLCQYVSRIARRPESYKQASRSVRHESTDKKAPGQPKPSSQDLDLAWRDVAEYVRACAEQVMPELKVRNPLRGLGVTSLEKSVLNTPLKYSCSQDMQSPESVTIPPATPTKFARSPEYVVRSSSPLQTPTPTNRQRSNSDHAEAAVSLLVLRQSESRSETIDAEQLTTVSRMATTSSQQRTIRHFASTNLTAKPTTKPTAKSTAKSTSNEYDLANRLHRDDAYGMNNPSGACQGCVKAWRAQEEHSDPIPPVPVDWCRIKRARGFLEGLRCSGCVAKKSSAGCCNVANDIELQATNKSSKVSRKAFQLLWTDLLEACDGNQAVANSYAPCFRTFEERSQIEEACANLKGVKAGTHTWDDVIRAENIVGNGDEASSTASEKSSPSVVTSPLEAPDLAAPMATTPNTEDFNESPVIGSPSPGTLERHEGQKKRKSLPVTRGGGSAKRPRLKQDSA